MYKTAVVITLMLLSCRSRITTPEQASLKDSIVKSYLAMIDTSQVLHDTFNYNFKILKAYINNDSAFFINMRKQIEARKQEQKEFSYPDTCTHLKKLSELLVDVAYRFRHSESFCPYSQVVTIIRSKDKIIVDYLEFSNGRGSGLEYADGRKVPPTCTVVKQFQKKLTRTEWDLLERKIKEADYYGITPYYSNPTTDGSWWQLEAYTKDAYYFPKYYSVYRHSPYDSAFCSIGKYMMELSGAKQMCSELF